MPHNMKNTVLLLALAMVVSVATAAEAQNEPSPEDLEAAKAAYAKGAEAFEAGKFDEAVKAFKESYRLSRNEVLLYNIGYSLDEAGDKELALFYYKKFLSDAPKDAANRDVAKERALELTKETAEKPDPKEIEPDPKDPKETKPAPTTLQHNIIEEVPPAKPVDVTAFAPENVGWKVYLHFRAQGAAKFTTVEMQKRYNELVARIPAAVVRGSSVQYYVEARDIADEMVARSGNSTSPHLIIIEDGAKARFYPDFDGGDAGDGSDINFENPAAGGQRDTGPSDRMTYAKWGATGAAIGFVALSATFWAISADASSSIEGIAVSSSQQDTCSEGRPCQPFSDTERDLQARGKRFETLGNVMFGLSIAAGATAGVLWYLDSKAKKEKKKGAVTTTPAIGPDFVGAAATVTF